MIELGIAVAALLAAGQAPLPPLLPEPERGVAVVLHPVSGRVHVHPDGVRRYRRLLATSRVPVGTTVDAQEGRVRLIAASDDDGGTWTAEFAAGKFTVTQPAEGAPVVTLRLTGPSEEDACTDADAAAAGRGKGKRVRRLWGDGHGRFRTSGRYSAATVRGTKWLTEDRCDGTLTRVVRGAVEVEDFTAEPPPGDTPREPPPGAVPAPGAETTTVVVPAGRSYVARPQG